MSAKRILSFTSNVYFCDVGSCLVVKKWRWRSRLSVCLSVCLSVYSRGVSAFFALLALLAQLALLVVKFGGRSFVYYKKS